MVMTPFGETNLSLVSTSIVVVHVGKNPYSPEWNMAPRWEVYGTVDAVAYSKAVPALLTLNHCCAVPIVFNPVPPFVTGNIAIVGS